MIQRQLLHYDTAPHKMCYNQTAMPSQSSSHVRNPNGSLQPLPCWNHSASKYNTSGNTTYAMFGAQQDDVAGVGYVVLFSALVLLLAMLYCMALRSGLIEASNRREQQAMATRHDSFSFDAMTLKERREYIDRVLKVKTFAASVTPHTSSDHSTVPVVLSKPLDDSGDTATDIEDLSVDGCLDDISLNDDDNPKVQPCCAICLEKFRNGDEVSYSHDPLCRHEYHTICIVEWLLKHMNCPYCRRYYIPVPPSVKKSAMTVASSESHPSSSLDEEAIPVSSSTLYILSSPRVEPIDVERGEGELPDAQIPV